MSITLNDDWKDRAAWDDFVEHHEQGRFCHLFNYGDVVGCYGYKPVRLAFLKAGALIAVLPCSSVRSVLFGRKLVSQPFSEYGGLLVDPSLDGNDLESVYGLLKDYVERPGTVHELEMHGSHGVGAAFLPGPFAVQNPHHIAVLALDRPAGDLWQKVVEYSVRKGVNKARGNHVGALEACDVNIVRERFYPLYLKSMKRLGVPPHALAYYLRCADLLGKRLKIFWAVRNGEVLAGLLGFVCGGRVNIVNIVSTPDSWKYSPNDLIHWEFIKWATEAGFKHFDFGSVRYEGQRHYKKKWGVAFEEHGYYMLSPDKAPKPVAFSSSAPGLVSISKVWSKYVPAAVARLAGPMIRQQLVR